MNVPERTLEVAAEVAARLEEIGVQTALIGAIAAAVHGYPRDTRDLDLAARVVNPRETLRVCEQALASTGYDVNLSMPDADDRLGGVIRLTGPDFGQIDIINFYNWKSLRPSTLGDHAVRNAQLNAELKLRVVDLPHLIALKLYGGGRKGDSDVLELLERNPDADRDAIRAVCQKHRLDKKLDRLLADLERDPDA